MKNLTPFARIMIALFVVGSLVGAFFYFKPVNSTTATTTHTDSTAVAGRMDSLNRAQPTGASTPVQVITPVTVQSPTPAPTPAPVQAPRVRRAQAPAQPRQAPTPATQPASGESNNFVPNY